MARLRVPVVCCVIGEGGSGGALAIGVGDHVMMLEYSTYSVISPEGCASILWKSADYAKDAASALQITSEALSSRKLIDEIVPEPLGGAHRDPVAMGETLKDAIGKTLDRLTERDTDSLLATRYQRLMALGRFKGD